MRARKMTAIASPNCPWRNEIRELDSNGLLRSMPEVEGMPGRLVTVNGKDAVNFSGNNYLGLASHPDVIKAGVESILKLGAGSTASRLIAGNSPLHRELESFLACWKGTEAALVFGSGYQANVGILASLAEEGDLIISDQLNHASVIDGCRLSRAEVRIYPHRDTNRVEHFVKTSQHRRKLVVTESVFSMDGDTAPLKDLDWICRRWGGILMIDEAHATGVKGANGQGLASELDVVPEIQMGTLGKAVGVSGAYVGGSRALFDLLVNRARSLIYTTAAPPAVCGASLKALKIINSEEGAARRLKLRANTELFQRLMTATPWNVKEARHIVPILIGDSFDTMRLSRELLERGIFAQGIRYPTVPEGTARLRFTIMSDHTPEDLETAVAVLSELSGSILDPDRLREHCLDELVRLNPMDVDSTKGT